MNSRALSPYGLLELLAEFPEGPLEAELLDELLFGSELDDELCFVSPEEFVDDALLELVVPAASPELELLELLELELPETDELEFPPLDELEPRESFT